MKRYFANYLCTMASIVLVTFMFSCKYEKVQPASYPDQKIYMTNAANASPNLGGNGVYAVNTVALPGQVFRYTVDVANSRFNVLLGAARSGITLDGDIPIDVKASTDTVTKLINKGLVLNATTQLLPASAYTLVPAITLNSGISSITFPLALDLNFLLGHPNQKYALAVTISSTMRAVNPALSTTIILIDTQFLIPTANFTPAADPGNSKKINFTNTSTNGVTYSWDFGDGSVVVTDKSPSHTYAAAGPYSVKLTVFGATGDAQKVTVVKNVTVS